MQFRLRSLYLSTTCCYGPEDAPAKYWRNGEIKHKDYNYILFKNAGNTSGIVKGTWPMSKLDFIGYHLPDAEAREKVCIELKRQLGEDYYILCPADTGHAIIIVPKIYYSGAWSNYKGDNWTMECSGSEYVLEKITDDGYKIIK